MLYRIFNTVIGDAVLESLNSEPVLKLLFSFDGNDYVIRSIYTILNNKNRIEWNKISQNALLEYFIREFRNRVDWRCISIKQNLAEAFVREFRDRVNWNWICEN